MKFSTTSPIFRVGGSSNSSLQKRTYRRLRFFVPPQTHILRKLEFHAIFIFARLSPLRVQPIYFHHLPHNPWFHHILYKECDRRWWSLDHYDCLYLQTTHTLKTYECNMHVCSWCWKIINYANVRLRCPQFLQLPLLVSNFLRLSFLFHSARIFVCL